MLVLTRKRQEQIHIGDDIEVKINLHRAQNYALFDKPDKAEQLMAAAARAAPDDPVTWFQRALIYAQSGQRERALDDLEQGRRLLERAGQQPASDPSAGPPGAPSTESCRRSSSTSAARRSASPAAIR